MQEATLDPKQVEREKRSREYYGFYPVANSNTELLQTTEDKDPPLDEKSKKETEDGSKTSIYMQLPSSFVATKPPNQDKEKEEEVSTKLEKEEPDTEPEEEETSRTIPIRSESSNAVQKKILYWIDPVQPGPDKYTVQWRKFYTNNPDDHHVADAEEVRADYLKCGPTIKLFCPNGENKLYPVHENVGNTIEKGKPAAILYSYISIVSNNFDNSLTKSRVAILSHPVVVHKKPSPDKSIPKILSYYEYAPRLIPLLRMRTRRRGQSSLFRMKLRQCPISDWGSVGSKLIYFTKSYNGNPLSLQVEASEVADFSHSGEIFESMKKMTINLHEMPLFLPCLPYLPVTSKANSFSESLINLFRSPHKELIHKTKLDLDKTTLKVGRYVLIPNGVEREGTIMDHYILTQDNRLVNKYNGEEYWRTYIVLEVRSEQIDIIKFGQYDVHARAANKLPDVVAKKKEQIECQFARYLKLISDTRSATDNEWLLKLVKEQDPSKALILYNKMSVDAKSKLPAELVNKATRGSASSSQ